MARAPEVHIFADPAELAREAAEFLLRVGSDAIKANGAFTIALSGGSTPAALYAVLTQPTWAQRLDWSRVHFFFGDERCVPPTHENSNFGMAQRLLFAPLGIAAEQIHRMRGEDPPDIGATDYENTLRRVVGTGAAGRPQLDVILLGMGDDGHTASLFPGTPALQEQTRWVVPGLAPTGITDRLTMTLGVIDHASVILFLVTGRNKAPIIRSVLERPPTEPVRYPAGLVEARTGRLLWYLDRAAASELSIRSREPST